MRSTPAMRARIRELMSKEQDDYDRAVECVLDDIEALEAALREIGGDVNSTSAFTLSELREIARAALAPEQERRSEKAARDEGQSQQDSAAFLANDVPG